MAHFMTRNRESWLPEQAEDWRRRHAPGPWPKDWDRSAKLMAAGAVALGLGCLAWYYVGGELRRYIKIHNM